MVQHWNHHRVTTTDVIFQVLSFLVFLSMRFSEEHPVCLTVPPIWPSHLTRHRLSVVVPNGLRSPRHFRRLCAAFRVCRVADRPRANLGTVPAEGEDSCPRRHQQLPSRYV